MLKTGIPNLDLILGGGVPEGDVLLVVGPAGSGKTTLALQMAFHVASSGKNAVYISTLSEPPTRLLPHIRPFTFFDERLIGKHLFVLGIYPLIKQGLEKVIDALARAVKEHQATLVIPHRGAVDEGLRVWRDGAAELRPAPGPLPVKLSGHYFSRGGIRGTRGHR